MSVTPLAKNGAAARSKVYALLDDPRVLGWGSIVLVLVAWELFARLFNVSALYLPRPSQIVVALVALFGISLSSIINCAIICDESKNRRGNKAFIINQTQVFSILLIYDKNKEDGFEPSSFKAFIIQSMGCSNCLATTYPEQ